MVRSAGFIEDIFGGIYSRPRFFPLLSDCATWPVGFLAAVVLSPFTSVGSATANIAALVVLAMILQAAFGYATGIYKFRWRVSSFDEVAALGVTCAATTAVLMVAAALLGGAALDPPETVIVAGSAISAGLMFIQRIVWRRWWERQRRPDAAGRKRTVVFGAGEGGAQVIRAMLADRNSSYFPVALLDDNPALANRRIDGIQVEGTRHDLAEVARRHNADTFLMAIAYANSKLVNESAKLASEAGLSFRVLPSTSELVGKMTVADVRPPTVEDLLGRDPIDIDVQSVASYITGKRVLITGAGGSIGSELSRQIARFGPSELYLLDRDESALHALQLSMRGRALLDCEDLIVADIRDADRIMSVFELLRPEVVFHTAALKHLSLLQSHPIEGIKTNTLGTKNLLEAAVETGVERFVNISTDKAADPTSVLGATKLAAERLTALAAKETGNHYLSVRFGNVLGSRGSVLPTFLDQIEKGNPITVTHKDVTRYFMTIPEAVRLVIQAGAIGEPAEVLILDMGEPVRILDLAQTLIDLLRPETKIEFTGLRPGEKMHEVLIAKDEVSVAKIHPRITHTAAQAYANPADALKVLGADVVAETRLNLADSRLFRLSSR